MSKRDDDSQADMEVGMTTAERRRRRRRGGGLRVPSDNVPRRTSTPPVVAPVPEDPALAMSIAYSFTNDASEPVPRVDLKEGERGARRKTDSSAPFEPVAPDVVPTVIDPPSSPVEEASFEMKTREMTAVDLEALGLSDSSTTLPTQRVSSPKIESPRTRTIENPRARGPIEATPGFSVSFVSTAKDALDDIGGSTLDPDPPEIITAEDAAVEPAPRPTVSTRPRLATVALSEEDLEEVMEAARAITNTVEPAAVTPPPAPGLPHPPAAHPPPPPPVRAAGSTPTHPYAKSEPVAYPVVKSANPPSVPEIDINELAERADSAAESSEIEIAIDDGEESKPTKAADPDGELGKQRMSFQRPSAADFDGHRPKPPSVPPPMTTQAPASTQAPPPPPLHKAPPAPPPKKTPPPAVSAAAVSARTDLAKPAERPRGKPWFVELFDEDYLRTLPFLTPQATQGEAEFVIDAMQLAPGAQVLDVGCGYGRHAMELAARGFHVVGLDLSTPLLVRGGEEAHRRGLTINFIRGDMRELDFDGQFDGAYCLFSTFGYFDDETNKKTAQNIARALKPGGKVMIEILNRDYVIADLPTRVWWEGEGCVVLEEVELNYFSSRIQVNRSVVFDDGRQLEQEISVRAYSLHEVGKLMHAAGFRVLEVSGGYQTRGRFFGNQSRHIIVLAERKDVSAS